MGTFAERATVATSAACNFGSRAIRAKT